VKTVGTLLGVLVNRITNLDMGNSITNKSQEIFNPYMCIFDTHVE